MTRDGPSFTRAYAYAARNRVSFGARGGYGSGRGRGSYLPNSRTSDQNGFRTSKFNQHGGHRGGGNFNGIRDSNYTPISAARGFGGPARFVPQVPVDKLVELERERLHQHKESNLQEALDMAMRGIGSWLVDPVRNHPPSHGVDGGGRTGDKEATCYVGNLDEKVTDALVYELCLQLGRIVSVHLPRDRVTQTHQGYGFVEYKDEESADYAARILNGTKLYGKPIRMNKASQDRNKTVDVGANLFIGNLHENVDEQALFETFKQFGDLVGLPKVFRNSTCPTKKFEGNLPEIQIARDSVTGKSKGYGFVNYVDFESSDAAVEAMNGQYLWDRSITVQYAYKKDGQGARHGDEAERALAKQALANDVKLDAYKPEKNIAGVANSAMSVQQAGPPMHLGPGQPTPQFAAPPGYAAPPQQPPVWGQAPPAPQAYNPPPLSFPQQQFGPGFPSQNIPASQGFAPQGFGGFYPPPGNQPMYMPQQGPPGFGAPPSGMPGAPSPAPGGFRPPPPQQGPGGRY